ncbi:MAG: metallophosphoesterase [Cyclonatronaceae bacterium]
MKRKEWFKIAGFGSAAAISNSFRLSGSAGNKKRVLRIAHMTDPHLDEEPKREYWTRQCISHIHNLEDRPDIIFNGGDTITDALARQEDLVTQQWNLWRRLKQDIKIPVVSCIGNHDVWGIEEAKSDSRYGKAWAVKELGLENRYYDFERNGWHFIVLDSTHLNEDGSWYTAKLDEEQFQWLKGKLESIPSDRPVFIFSHIPILCAAAFFDGDNESSGNWRIPGAWVHIDARRIVELFHKHPNVKVGISGHIHLLDEVVYNDVTYYCNGAVCGSWWSGNYHQTPPGYAMINLYEDGTFDREYMAYGWKES